MTLLLFKNTFAVLPHGQRNIDWLTFSLYLALTLIGIMMIYTVGYKQGYPDAMLEFLTTTPVGKQIIWFGISLIAFGIVSLIDWKFWSTFAYPIYAFSLLLLISVLFLGTTIKGATSWFIFGGFSFQPSELAKLGTCLALAAYLSSYDTNLKEWSHQLTAAGLVLVPMLLILLQPDAGSALTFLSFSFALYRKGWPAPFFVIVLSFAALFIMGLALEPMPVILALLALAILVLCMRFWRKRYWLGFYLIGIASGYYYLQQGMATQVLWAGLAALLLLALVIWLQDASIMPLGILASVAIGSLIIFSSNYAFHNYLKPHQQDRINVWLNPEKCDPQGSLYNVLQSKMAISSGGLQGKGFLHGNLTQGNFVPEQITDFIFTTIGEEQGFIGSFSVLAMFLLLLLRMLQIAERQRSDFSRWFGYGVAGLLFTHFFVNVGMTMGLMPIIGIPLPFISKGGSSLIGFSLMIAILLKMDRHRYSI